MDGPWTKYATQTAPAPAVAPDAPADGPWTRYQQAAAPQADAGSSWADTAIDAAKSLGAGVERGAIALATAPATADRIGKWAVSWADPLLEKVLGAPPAQDPNKQPPDLNRYVGPEAVTKGVEALQGPLHEPLTTVGKFAEKIGEFAPQAAIGPAAGILPRLASQAVLPGVADEAAGEATAGTPYEGIARTAAAMIAPSAAGLGRRIITPNPISAERQGMVDTLRGEGVPLTAGQVTGSRPLKYMESVLGDTPGTGGAAERIDEAQRGAFTAAALRRIGETSDRAMPEVMQRAADRISGQFDALGARNTMQVDPQLQQDLGNAIRTYHQNTLGVIPADKGQQLHNVVSEIVTQPNGQMPGRLYQNTRSSLGKAAEANRISDPTFAQALRDVRDGLDNAMGRSVSPDDAAAWNEARQQYGALRLLERASTGAGENAAQGFISPSALRNATAARDRSGYARGQGDFADLARAGEAVMKPLPNSGTAPRAHVNHMAHMGSTVLGALLGGTEGAIAGAAVPAVAGPLAGRALLSRPVQSYLANQLLSAAPASQRSGLLDLLLRGNTAGSSFLPISGP